MVLFDCSVAWVDPPLVEKDPFVDPPLGREDPLILPLSEEESMTGELTPVLGRPHSHRTRQCLQREAEGSQHLLRFLRDINE